MTNCKILPQSNFTPPGAKLWLTVKSCISAKQFNRFIPDNVVNSFLCRAVSFQCEVCQYWQQADHATLFPLAAYHPSNLAHASAQPHTVPFVVHQKYQSHPTDMSADPLWHQYIYVSQECCQTFCNIIQTKLLLLFYFF